MKKHIWKIVAVVAVIALGLAVWYADKAAQAVNADITIESHMKGNVDSSIKIVEYSDFQCPACAAAYTVVNSLLEEFGDDISFEYRHFPLISIHPQAMPAARAAEAAAQQGKFFEMHDKLFENQTTWSQASNPAVFFAKYAEEIGLNVSQFKKQANASKIDQAVRKSFDEARDLGLTGTPTFMMNGTKMEFNSYQEFRDMVNAAVNGESPVIATEPEVTFGL